MRVLDLFSGIGGFSLGLERASMKTVAFCEIEPYARRVLAKHWPGVPIFEDVRSLTADVLRDAGIGVDLICGGFPCQDISLAGKGAGIEGERSGLWSEYARLIGELMPQWVIVENVAGLRSRGIDRVLRDMAAIGFDAEWHCVPASAVGAPHRRDRVWIIAYPGGQQYQGDRAQNGRPKSAKLHEALANAAGNGRQPWRACDATKGARRGHAHRGAVRANLSHAYGPRLAFGQGLTGDDGKEQPATVGADWWLVEPDVDRVAHGVPSRVDRLRGLGNAVVPQIPELIGRAILASEATA